MHNEIAKYCNYSYYIMCVHGRKEEGVHKMHCTWLQLPCGVRCWYEMYRSSLLRCCNYEPVTAWLPCLFGGKPEYLDRQNFWPYDVLVCTAKVDISAVHNVFCLE